MRKIVIIHDSQKEVQLLRDYLENIPGVAITGVFSTKSEAGIALTDTRCDILIAGLPVLSSLKKDKNAPMVWICMGSEQSVTPPAIHKHIFGYLQLPFSFERVFGLLQTVGQYVQQLPATTSSPSEYIFIKSEYKLIRINLADILFLSGLRDYTQIFLKGKLSPLTTLQNLKDFESKLPSSAFIRVHRSYIIALGQVDAISRNEIMIGTYTIPIGHAYRQLLDEMITKNS